MFHCLTFSFVHYVLLFRRRCLAISTRVGWRWLQRIIQRIPKFEIAYLTIIVRRFIFRRAVFNNVSIIVGTNIIHIQVNINNIVIVGFVFSIGADNI